VAPPAYNFRRK